MKVNKKGLYIAVFILYVAVLLCGTILLRETPRRVTIYPYLFWGYKVDNPAVLYRDNLINILLYIPIGYLVGLIAPKHKLLAAVLVGLFLSENVEISQLIWRKGSFDVDDLFNNTVGALIGGLIVVTTFWIWKKRKNSQGDEKPVQHT